MTIGLVTPYYPDKNTMNSGLANHFSTLATALINAGHQVVVIHIRPGYADDTQSFHQTNNGNLTLLTCSIQLPRLLNRPLKNRWAVMDFLIKIRCMLFAAAKLNGLIKKHQIDVLETTSYYSLCYFYLQDKKPSVPVITRVSTTFAQIMDEHYPFKSRLFNRLGQMEINMIQRSKFRITHARHHAVELEKLYQLPADSFTIIPHATTLPALPQITQPVNAPVKVLFVGRMEYRKGIDTLLKAIPLVLAEYDDVVFELIGADTGDAYQQQFRDLNNEAVNAKVLFRGMVNAAETQTAYAGCDIFVAPSRYESFGLIYIEAMSYGKPVIGCNVGGVNEIIEPDKNGLFALPGNGEDLARQLLALLNDPQKSIQMGRNARQTVEQKFTPEKLAEGSINYYRQAIAKLH